MREGHCQSDEHWNHFKDITRETSWDQEGVHMGFSERRDTILNPSELQRKSLKTANTLNVGPEACTLNYEVTELPVVPIAVQATLKIFSFYQISEVQQLSSFKGSMGAHVKRFKMPSQVQWSPLSTISTVLFNDGPWTRRNSKRW